MIIWGGIAGYENLYQVSNSGLVRSLDRYSRGRSGMVLRKGKILKPGISKKGYHYVSLWENSKGRTEHIHTLVATVFVAGKSAGLEVNHKDGDKSNNNDWNLEWGTHKHNIQHASRMGLMATGERHGRYKGNQGKEDEGVK
jgi:hypothetical protein